MAKRPSGFRIDDPAWALVQALISYWGVTDAAGGAGGADLQCADLANQPEFDGNQVVIISGPYGGQARDINGTTLLGVVTPAANFGGVITANTIFAILPIRTVPAEVAAVEAKLDLPAIDSVLVATVAQVIGNKASTAVYAKDNVSDIVRYLKGLMDSQITASGVADAGSGVGLIRDAARTEADDWWNGQTVLMLTGAAAFQKRPITDFVAATDDIIVAPNFDAAVAAGDIYVILAHYNMIVPRAADDVANALTSQVIGRKDDTALYAAAANATLMRYIKGLITAGIAVPGAVSDAGPAITDFDTDLAEATDDHYNGMLLMFLDGPNAGQAHTIDDYGGAAKNVSFLAGDQWTDVPVNGNSFVILPRLGSLLRALHTIPGADAATNVFMRDVLGNKEDTALTAYTAADSIMRYIKGILDSVAGTSGARIMSKLQIAATTIDLNQVAGTYDLFTGTTQDVVVEKLVIRMPDAACGGALTSISIHTDDTTPQIFISAADGAVANLTAEAQLAWTGAVLIDAGTGAKIQLTIAGGAHGVAYVCDVIAEYRAVVSGGYLA